MGTPSRRGSCRGGLGRGGGWLGVALAIAGCSAGPRHAAVAGGRADPPPSRTELQIAFDPPLANRGELLVQHESGFSLCVVTERTGVTIRVPPGPMRLRLTVDGEAHERTCSVGVGAQQWLWTP